MSRKSKRELERVVESLEKKTDGERGLCQKVPVGILEEWQNRPDSMRRNDQRDARGV